MALTAMRITRGPTGAIGIGLTDTGATIDNGADFLDRLRSENISGRAVGFSHPSLSIVHSNMIIEGQASPFTRLRASVRL